MKKSKKFKISFINFNKKIFKKVIIKQKNNYFSFYLRFVKKFNLFSLIKNICSKLLLKMNNARNKI
jgi:hypothetical protein